MSGSIYSYASCSCGARYQAGLTPSDDEIRKWMLTFHCDAGHVVVEHEPQLVATWGGYMMRLVPQGDTQP